MADIFVSYTSSDRDWAFWIGQELEKLGHVAHLHDWEISGGGNIMAWMSERHQKADRVLCVVSSRYLEQPYSALERQGAERAAITKRPNFVLPVFIEGCEAPTLFALLKRCDLHGFTEEEARGRLEAFLKPAAKPTASVPFPGTSKPTTAVPEAPVAFPGGPRALSNIPISVPRYFVGRDDALAKIKIAFAGEKGGRVAITALHGLRGVGKTTLAAAYAEMHGGDYRATWWIRAETETTIRADLVTLGVSLGWIATGEKEEVALATVLERLRQEGSGILLVYDNVKNATKFKPYMPRSGAAHVIVTSTSPNWNGVGVSIQIKVWPNEVGADYLIASTGRDEEREAALALSEALGGLPLAQEQAASYCDRTGASLAEYRERFEAKPTKFLNRSRDKASEYGRTVAKTFALAIEEAAKEYPAAKLLIVYAALLAPEPIPLFLFSEAREKFGEPFATALADDGLDEAVGALRSFALVDRGKIWDERDPAIATDCIRLHRLVREVAAARCKGKALEDARRSLIEAVARVYPAKVFNESKSWPRARRLDAIALDILDHTALSSETQETASSLLNQLALYRQSALAEYAQAQSLVERAIAIQEKKAAGPAHRNIARGLNTLGHLLQLQGNFSGAQSCFERAQAIVEQTLGPDHADVAISFNNLGHLRQVQGDLGGAQSFLERSLKIVEKAFGPDDPVTARSLSRLGHLMQVKGDLVEAQRYCARALKIREKLLGSDHLDTASSLNSLGEILQAGGDMVGARVRMERALAIRERLLGPDHPDTATSLATSAGYCKCWTVLGQHGRCWSAH